MSKKAIKKYKHNEYVQTNNGIWVRNPADNANPIDLNHFSSAADYHLFIQNEIKLKSFNLMNISDYSPKHKNCVIVSDGYDFQNKQHLLSKISQDHIIIGVNGALKKWNPKLSKMNFYCICNPYPDAISFLPSVRYFPTCILASRTNSDFIKKYKGTLMKYSPTYEESFSGMEKKHNFKIDDYRNPICAAFNIAIFMGAENILLFCCDGTFENERHGAEKLDSGLFTYPQHRINHEIIDELAYFVKINDEYIKISDYSQGWNYKNIIQISENDITSIFNPVDV